MSFNKIIISFLFFIIPATGVAQEREWDYQTYPPLDISILHAPGTFQIDEAGVIGGTILYDVQFKNSYADTLFLDAVELDIRSVKINGGEVRYTVSEDRLNILLSDHFSAQSRSEERRVGISLDIL